MELSYNAVNLQSNYLELTELKHVLEKTQVFFTEVGIDTELGNVNGFSECKMKKA